MTAHHDVAGVASVIANGGHLRVDLLGGESETLKSCAARKQTRLEQLGRGVSLLGDRTGRSRCPLDSYEHISGCNTIADSNHETGHLLPSTAKHQLAGLCAGGQAGFTGPQRVGTRRLIGQDAKEM